jgi:hypothetical protein
LLVFVFFFALLLRWLFGSRQLFAVAVVLMVGVAVVVFVVLANCVPSCPEPPAGHRPFSWCFDGNIRRIASTVQTNMEYRRIGKGPLIFTCCVVPDVLLVRHTAAASLNSICQVSPNLRLHAQTGFSTSVLRFQLSFVLLRFDYYSIIVIVIIIIIIIIIIFICINMYEWYGYQE